MNNSQIDIAGLQERTKLEVLHRCRLFRDVPLEEMKEMSSRSSLAYFKKGMTIFEDGDPSDFFYAVQDGLVKVFKSTSTGQHLTFTVAGRGDTLNATAVTVGCYFMSAYALNDVTVIKTDKKAYMAFLTKHPRVAIELIAMLSKRLNRECDRVVTLLGSEVGQRLVVSLATLARKFGPSLSLTREELANCAGTTTETTIRVLSRLKKEGIIGCNAVRGGIIISDLERLKKLVIEDEGWI